MIQVFLLFAFFMSMVAALTPLAYLWWMFSQEVIDEDWQDSLKGEIND